METQDNQKNTLISMMRYLDEVFRRENIWYTLAYGTLLGAVRENGFIPWDMDMDICVKYKDLRRIRELISTDTDCPYHLCIPGQEKRYTSNHDRLIRRGLADFDCHIDIYTLIGLPTNYREAKKYIKKICTISSLFSAKYKLKQNTKKNALLLPAKLVAWIFSDRFIARFHEKQLNMYPIEKARYVSVMGAAYKEVYEVSLFTMTESLRFENDEFMCISEYDKYLRQLYGDYTVPKKSDYMVKQ